MTRTKANTSVSALCLVAGATAWLWLVAQPVQADQIAGETIDVQPSATLRNPEGRVTLRVGMDVRMGDLVRTNRRGEAQIIFTDETRLVVGPNSSLVIESYLLRSANRANSFAVRTLGGTFRMITGKSDKSAYEITTPTAKIGVRGTTFDWAVWTHGRTDFFLYEGAARFCDEFNLCLNVTETCAVARAQRFRRARFLEDTEEAVDSLAVRFPYFVNDRNLNAAFRARARGCSQELISRVGLAASARAGRSSIHDVDRGTHANDTDREPPGPPERDRPEPEPPGCEIC